MNKLSLALSALALSMVSGSMMIGCAGGSDEPEIGSGAQAQAADAHGQYGYVMLDETVGGNVGSVATPPAQVTGRLAPELIRDTVRLGFADLTACKHGPAAGAKLTVKFVIDGNGAVKGASTSGAVNVDDTMAACVREAFSDMHFPKSTGGDAEVEYPLIF